MNDEVLIVESIVKQFHEQRAVNNLTFSVKRGEIFALLGPNGAGKTTTIRMLLGIIRPDSGSITFDFEHSDGAPPSSAKLGYLPEDRGLYRDIPVIKTLTYMGVLRGLSRKEAASRARKWLDQVGLGDRINAKLETLSRGNQQKVQFISAVLHQPEFTVLDEPFSGLDPLNQESFIEIIGEMRKQGTTILLCAHQMGLVERIAERVLLMNRGRQVLFGTLAEVRDSSSTSNKVIVTVAPDADITGLLSSPLVQQVEHRGKGEFVFYIKRGEAPQKFLLQAASTVDLIDLYTEKNSLHDIFIEAVRRSGGEISEEDVQ
jgi:ABC-2 type transport system ATP-binding protein